METLTKTTWNIDPSHSEIIFKVKHLVISTVSGYFNSYEGQLIANGDSFDGAEISFSADIDSIQTKNADRDGHLKSADFFDAANHPKLTFHSKSFKEVSKNEFVLTGDLTIRGTTKEVALKATLGGVMQDPYGNTKAGFEIRGAVNRKEFGLTWSAVTEAGGVVVGDEVKLQLDVQVVKS